MSDYIVEFGIPYPLLLEVLIIIVVLSFFIERALSVIFESSLFIAWYDPEGHPEKKKKGIKEFLSIAVSIAAAWFWKFDAITILFKTHTEPQIYGYVITGLIIAGGSKASIKFFKETMGFMSTAEKMRKERKEEENPKKEDKDAKDSNGQKDAKK